MNNTIFDWKFYSNYYKELNLKTEEDAMIHWITYGKKEGRLRCNNNNLVNIDLSIIPKPIIKEKYEIKDKVYFRDIESFMDSYDTTYDIVISNPKIEFRYFCYRYLDYMRNITLPPILLNQKYEAVLIEYRQFPHLEFLIRNMISKLGKDWSHTVVCGNLNYDYIKNICNSISPNIKVIKTDYDNLNQTTYSKFMASVEFWNMFVGEKILIYQEDSIIFKDNIKDFLCWDYIGAPWPKNQNDNINNVGNGGFSLRTKQCMLETINKISIENTVYNSSTLQYIKNSKMTLGPEDVYFSLNMIRYKLGKVADWESASLFSSESIFNKDSLGGHNFWINNKLWKEHLYDNVIAVTYNMFDWIKYLDDNGDLIAANIKTKDKAWEHWTQTGKNEGRKAQYVSNNFNNTNVVYIISNNKGGGSVKYLDDIVNHYNNKEFIYINYNHKLQNYNYSSMSILFLQHLFFTDINLKDIIEIKNKYNCKLVISIHDYYWLNNKVLHDFDDTTSWHNAYLNDNINIHEDIKTIFSIADDIIHPSQFTWDIHSKYFSTKNFKLVYHNDYIVNNSKNIPKITNCINIGILHDYSVCKGKEYIERLKTKYTMYKKYKINFMIVNENIPRYKESEFYDYVDKYNIHCMTFLNKWGETYCYSLTKALNVGLPILYNNFGAFKERIPSQDHYFKVYDNENDNNINKLYKIFENMIDYIISNNNMYNNKHVNTNIVYNKYYDDLFNKKNLNMFAIYFPQFHSFKENNINYYDNFSDIMNLSYYFDENKTNPEKLEKLSITTYNLDDMKQYNLTNQNITMKQVALASYYGINGFAIYYYWFSVNTITNKNLIMENGYMNFFKNSFSNFKVFFVWANEDWSNNPAFNTKEKIYNIYDNDNFKKHVLNLINYFKHDNYYKINNKPVFFVHHPWFIELEQIHNLYKVLNKVCIENNFDGINFKLNSMDNNYEEYDTYDFHPNYKKPPKNSGYILDNMNVLDYEKYIENIKIQKNKITSIFFDFNNTARLYKPNKLHKSTRVINNNNTNINKYINMIKENYNDSNTILLINAWNEWGEKMHIEPSQERGTYFLDLLKNNFG